MPPNVLCWCMQTVGKDEIKRFTCGEREWEFMKPSPDCESDWFGCYGPALRTQVLPRTGLSVMRRRRSLMIRSGFGATHKLTKPV